MDMLKDAVAIDGAFPAGLWWMGRDSTALLEPVNELFEMCAAADVAAYFVEIETFDETFGALGRGATLPERLRDYVDNLRAEPRSVDCALPQLDRGPLPVLRMNALPVLETPRRALQAIIPTTLDQIQMRTALSEVGWRGAVVSSGRQVLALGSAGVLAKALNLDGTPVEIDIDPAAHDAPSPERALIYEAITRGLARKLPVRSQIRDSRHRLIVAPENTDRPDSSCQANARKLLEIAYGEPLTGHCPLKLGRGPDGQARRFAESVELSLEWRLGVLWLLFVPRTWVSGLPRDGRSLAPQGDPASAWRKERWVNRRNERWAAIIDAWANSIAPANRTEVPVLPHGLSERDLVGGQFVLGHVTAYSREAK
jgi:hypothetical protein